MAIEKMKILSIIGRISDLDEISRRIVLNGKMHIMNAMSELKENYLNLEASEENIEIMQELNTIRPYVAKRSFSNEESMLKTIYDVLSLQQEIGGEKLEVDYCYESTADTIKQLFLNIKEISDEISQRITRIGEKQDYIKALDYLKNTGIELKSLIEGSFIKAKLITLSRDNYQKLKGNYENIPALVFKIKVEDDNVVALTFTPAELYEDAERIFVSLNYNQYALPKGYSGVPEDIIFLLEREIENEIEIIENLKKSAIFLKDNYALQISHAYSIMSLEKKAEKLKSDAALSQNLFFIFGFMPKEDVDELSDELSKIYGERIMTIASDADKERKGAFPPTKLRNLKLFSPFEAMVKMYGTPSYKEKDPTVYFGLTYMLLFGAMFGDVGQGLVIFLIGQLLIYYKKQGTGGGILSRLGISSAVFGLLYGSVFGSEEIIEAVLVRPMTNINVMLLGAVGFGIILLTISFIYSLSNAIRNKNFEEGIFGKDGAVGFAFFLILVATIVSKLTGIMNIDYKLVIPIMSGLLLLTVFKKPIAAKLLGHSKIYETSAADYYIEAGFGLIETVLSIASNIISFIRVGAFALNHVGLYIAFSTMAQMINSKLGGIAVLIIGNIIIIGLEGLIVFIQSLRLEYYELFSKYYSGSGVDYMPIRMEE